MHPGELTLEDLFGGDLSQIFQPSIVGGADLRADAVVDFSTLGADFASILPSISTRILIDFGLSWDTTNGFQVSSPQVVFGDISLDLGSFITKFAAPILNEIKQVLDPLAWLIGPNGFLNERIPLLSDLAGHTITGADIVEFFDPTDAPTIQSFLSFVLELYHLIDLVQQASSEGDVKLNFGDIVLVQGSGPGIPNPNEWAFFDSPLNVGLGSTDLSNMPDLSSLNVPDSLPAPSIEGAEGAATSEFANAIDPTPNFDFPLLDHPSSIINLLFGKPVTLVEIQLPELSFSFTYMQDFPIIGPLVGTFEGGIGAKLDLRLGYDTQGISDFIQSKDPASLLEGFFFDPHDANGNPLPVATLTAEIAVGAAIDLGLIKAGVEGGITATILFNWDDLNNDGKVRLDELKANILANGGDPLAVFDITGELDLFLKAYVTIDLFVTSFTLSYTFPTITLFKFSVDFTRPSFLGDENNGTLTLAIGPSSKNRLQGNLSDISETIFVASDGGTGKVKVWSDQFGRSESNAQEFTGVTSIVGNGGAGDDMIDLSGLNDTTISVVIHGGDGNDTLVGPTASKCDATTHICAQLYGDGGDDTLTSKSNQMDQLDGGDGNDTLNGSTGPSVLKGDAGNDSLNGGTGAETLDGGSGNDTINGGGGADDYIGLNATGVVHITSSNTDGAGILDMTGRPESITFTLKDNKIMAGWGLQLNTSSIISGVNDYTNMIVVDNIDAVGTILGGNGADVFDVYQTRNTGSFTTLLNGQGGNDTYDFIHFGSGPSDIHAHVTDTGNPWDSGDQIVIDGSSGADTVDVSGTLSGGEINGTGSQTVHYDAPAANLNVISLLVNGNDGADNITVESTSATVPVKVDGGLGNDIITVGNGSVSGIVGVSRPGMNSPYGVGPLVVVGGGGLDTLVVDDHTDSTGQNGSLESWVEARQTAPDGTEVGAVGDLGMQLYAQGSDIGHNPAGPGRVEFEDVEALTVLLGTGDDTFTVGGDTLFSQLPQARQQKVFYFDESPAVMTSISGGNGDDTFPIVSTVELDRTAFDASDGLIAVTTEQDGVLNTSNEVQHIDVRDGKTDTENSFTLTLNGETTGVLPFTASKTAVQNALNALLGVSGVTVTGGSGVFTVTFPSSMGNVPTLLATHVQKLVDTSTTQQGVLGTTSEIQHLDVSGVTGGNGYYTLQLDYQQTKPLPLNASASDIQAAMRAAFSELGNPTNVSASGSGGSFDITFDPSVGNVDQLVAQIVPLYVDGGNGSDQLNVQSIYEDTFFNGDAGNDSSNINLNAMTLAPFTPSDLVGHVNVTEIQAGNGGHDEIQRVAVTNANGGSFELAFGGQYTAPIAWDAPATGDCTALSNGSSFCSVQAALAALTTIGTDAKDNPNVGVTRSALDGSYTIEFIGALGHAAQPLLQSNVIVGVSQQGEQQTVVLHNVTGGTFSLDYTYDVQPLGLALDPNAVGSLAAGTYYYEVTAITGAGETLPSAEASTTVGTSGAIRIDWGDVPGALSYRIYKGTSAGSESGYFTSMTASFFDDGVALDTGTFAAGTPPTTTNVHAVQTTVPIAYNATPIVVQNALAALPTIGTGNVSVTGSAGNYTIQFTGTLASNVIAPLVGNTSSLRSNGLHAIATLDGGADPDIYDINLIGGTTNSLVNVFDSGGGAGDSLTVNGTDYADVFLLRSATADDGLAFIALINGPTPLTPSPGDPVERVNYNAALESIIVNGGNGDDQFYVDDTRASITINGDEGNDFFQIGQLYKSRRTPALAGIAPEDVFATIDTTQGWLSNGISDPMTINGGIGDDNFIVFHNLAVLNLNGDDGNDSFLVQAFALAGSTEDPPCADRPERRRGRRQHPVRRQRTGEHRRRRRLRHGHRHRHRVQRRLRDHADRRLRRRAERELRQHRGAGRRRRRGRRSLLRPRHRLELHHRDRRRPRLRPRQRARSDACERRHQQRPARPQRDHHAQRREHRRRVRLQRHPGRRHLRQRRRQRHAGRRRHPDERRLRARPVEREHLQPRGRDRGLLRGRPDAPTGSCHVRRRGRDATGGPRVPHHRHGPGRERHPVRDDCERDSGRVAGERGRRPLHADVRRRDHRAARMGCTGIRGPERAERPLDHRRRRRQRHGHTDGHRLRDHLRRQPCADERRADRGHAPRRRVARRDGRRADDGRRRLLAGDRHLAHLRRDASVVPAAVGLLRRRQPRAADR